MSLPTSETEALSSHELEQDGVFFAESGELARFLLESNRDCILFLDAEERLLYINKVGQELLALRRLDRFLHKSWLNLLGENAREAAKAAMARTGKGKQTEVQVFSPAFSGEPR